MTLFKQNELTDSRVQALLRVHLENARALTPLESTHALDIEGLKDPAVTFWTLWRDDKVLGCGALKELSARHGEAKQRAKEAIAVSAWKPDNRLIMHLLWLYIRNSALRTVRPLPVIVWIPFRDI